MAEVGGKDGGEGAVDGAGAAVADGMAVEFGGGRDIGGGAEYEDFGGAVGEGEGYGGFFDGGEDAARNEQCAGQQGGAVHGGAGEDVVGRRDEEAAVGGDDAEVLGGECGEVAVGVEREDEVESALDGFAAHEGVGEVVDALDACEEVRFDRDAAQPDAGAAGMQFHEGAREADGEDEEQRLGAFERVGAVAAGAAGNEYADEGVGMAAGAEDGGEDAVPFRAGPGDGETDLRGAAFEAVPVGGEVVGGAGGALEGLEEAVAAVDHVVVDGDDHEVGVGGDGVPPAGIHGVVVPLVVGAVGVAEGGEIAGGEVGVHGAGG